MSTISAPTTYAAQLQQGGGHTRNSDYVSTGTNAWPSANANRLQCFLLPVQRRPYRHASLRTWPPPIIEHPCSLAPPPISHNLPVHPSPGLPSQPKRQGSPAFQTPYQTARQTPTSLALSSPESNVSPEVLPGLLVAHRLPPLLPLPPLGAIRCRCRTIGCRCCTRLCQPSACCPCTCCAHRLQQL